MERELGTHQVALTLELHCRSGTIAAWDFTLHTACAELKGRDSFFEGVQ